MALYEDVVSAICAAHGYETVDSAEFARHLRGLVPALHELRASYRSGWGSVAVTYTRDVTEAYMLAYYPHYVGLTARALAVLPDRALGDEKRLRVCAFACGPAPEPVALAQYLLARGYETEVLALALLDIVPDRWSWAQAVSLERVLPTCWDRQTFVAEPKAVDINAPNFVDQVTDFVSRSDLVLFQNCLNEFSADQAQVADNAEALIATMKPGAVLLMADINNYPAGRASLETFATAAERGAVVVQSPDELLSVAPAPGRPAVLDAHLFLDGEYPRRRDFEFRCLAARVPR